MAAPSQRTVRRLAVLGVVLFVAVIGLRTNRQRSMAPAATRQVETAPVATPTPSGINPTEMPGGASPVVEATTVKYEAGALFAYAEPVNAAALDAALPAPAPEIHYVRINNALIAGAGSPFWQPAGEGRVELPLPEGGRLTIVLDGSEALGPGRFTGTGHVEGQPGSRAVFAYNQGFLHAAVTDGEGGNYALRAATAELAQFYRVDPALVPPCGGGFAPTAELRARTAATAQTAPADGSTAATAMPSTDTTGDLTAAATASEVHVMILYTQAVLPTLSGTARTAALQSAFDAVTAKINSDFATSLIATRVKLVKIAETNYPGDDTSGAVADWQTDALTALQSSTDGIMDEIHALRSQAGADLVCLALNRRDSVSSGIGFVLDTPGERFNSRFAFSVVQYSNLVGTSVMPHELGHNFGCVHVRAHSTAAGAYAYSYGYVFTATDGRQYHDIMSYPPGTELAYFSNPATTAPSPAPANSPGGIAPGEAGESDTALTIENTSAEVAAYRAAVLPSAPTITLQPASRAVSAGASATFTVAATPPPGGSPPVYQWQFNGNDIAGATGTSFTVTNVQPASTGLYSAVVTSGASSTSNPAVLGISTTAKLVGAGAEVGSNITLASNGFTYDQVLPQASALSVRADPGQITRMSFVDLTDDIVQVEFSGAGVLSLVLDNPSGPANAVNYDQPAVTYMKGHAGIVITGANETTNVSVFSVGRVTAVDQSLFKGGVAYDGFADIAFIAIVSTNGRFGGVRTGNTSFFATQGLTGIYAPGVQFTGPVYVGDISAFDAATPVILLGSAADTRITGGDLLQSNNQAVKVSGLTQLSFTAGQDSNGNPLSAKSNRAVLLQNGTDVTAQLVTTQSP